MSRRALKGREIPRLEFGQARLDDRQGHVAVGRRPAVAGDVLDHRQDAAGQQALGGRPAQRGDLVRGGSP